MCMRNISFYIYYLFISNNIFLPIIFCICPISSVYTFSFMVNIILFMGCYALYIFFYEVIFYKNYCILYDQSKHYVFFLTGCYIFEIMKNTFIMYFLSGYIVKMMRIYNNHIPIKYGLIGVIVVLFLICLMLNDNSKTIFLYNIMKIIFLIIIGYVMYAESNMIYKKFDYLANFSFYNGFYILFLIIIFAEKKLQNFLIIEKIENSNNLYYTFLEYSINCTLYACLLFYIREHTNISFLKSTFILSELFLKNYVQSNLILHVSHIILIIMFFLGLFNILINTKKLTQKTIYLKTKNSIYVSEMTILLLNFILLIMVDYFFSENSNIIFCLILFHFLSILFFLLYQYVKK